ncbi:hypothetical protein HK101_006746, partial [Irineochytrium annulatum]
MGCGEYAARWYGTGFVACLGEAYSSRAALGRLMEGMENRRGGGGTGGAGVEARGVMTYSLLLRCWDLWMLYGADVLPVIGLSLLSRHESLLGGLSSRREALAFLLPGVGD